jgi:hypothetical protein
VNLTDYQQFVLGIVSGSIPTLIGVYIAHRLSVKRSKERKLLPYLRELHGVVSRIMDNKQAEYFREAYEQRARCVIYFASKMPCKNGFNSCFQASGGLDAAKCAC